VLAPAQGGRHASGRETHGDTMIVDPWGEILDRVSTGPGVAIADIDLERIASVRASLPALEHRTLR
jgi:deaminated glutathione amidase